MVGLFALCANFLFVKDLFLRGNSSMRPFFDALPWILLFFVPAIAMRLLAEEHRLHTIEVLLSLPIKESEIVAGKLLAVVAGVVIGFVLTLSTPLALYALGNPSFSEIVISYTGAFLLSLLYGALSLFFSSVSRNQLVAYLLSVAVLFITHFFSGDFLATLVPSAIRETLGMFAPLNHYQTFLKGVVDLRAVVYFVSMTAIVFYATVMNLKKRS